MNAIYQLELVTPKLSISALMENQAVASQLCKLVNYSKEIQDAFEETANQDPSTYSQGTKDWIEASNQLEAIACNQKLRDELPVSELYHLTRRITNVEVLTEEPSVDHDTVRLLAGVFDVTEPASTIKLNVINHLTDFRINSSERTIAAATKPYLMRMIKHAVDDLRVRNAPESEVRRVETIPTVLDESKLPIIDAMIQLAEVIDKDGEGKPSPLDACWQLMAALQCAPLPYGYFEDIKVAHQLLVGNVYADLIDLEAMWD